MSEHEPMWVRRMKRRAWIPVGFGVVVLAVVALIAFVGIPWVLDGIE